ncbi:MAG: transglycosylase SLT domain-containing protein [Zoogloeaceae bacterium]|nr:transglycosylase SLT domain-containing protein [Zoogloeaceae bacterium]
MRPPYFHAIALACLLLLCPALQAQSLETDVLSTLIAPPAAAPVSDAAPPQPAPAADPAIETTLIPLVDQEPPTPPPAVIDLTVSPDNLWQRIRNGFAMPDLNSPLVANRQAWYLNHPDSLNRIVRRSGKYLYYIVEEIEQRGMPTELALLPMMESAFNPLAHSRARALGMWQFIPSTGKNYKLEQNFWRDERRDVIASTKAALDYLQSIYEMHGDWHLALASYNWGENAVRRAIAKNETQGLPTDYENLSMPKETQYYVPSLQALKNIIAQPEVFGFDLAPLSNQPYFDTVALPHNMDVAVAAKLAEMPVDEFIALNPAYHRPLIRGDSTTQLVLPTGKVDVFQNNLQRYKAQDKPLTYWRTYALKKGETLDKVAARHNISTVKLKQLNSISPKTKIQPGFTLLVPDPGAQVSDQLAESLPKIPAEGRKATKQGKKKAPVRGKPKSKPTGQPVKR